MSEGVKPPKSRQTKAAAPPCPSRNVPGSEKWREGRRPKQTFSPPLRVVKTAASNELADVDDKMSFRPSLAKLIEKKEKKKYVFDFSFFFFSSLLCLYHKYPQQVLLDTYSHTYIYIRALIQSSLGLYIFMHVSAPPTRNQVGM